MMPLRRAVVVLALTGCAQAAQEIKPTPPPPPPARPANLPVKLSLRTTVEQPGSVARDVNPGEVLRSGDRLRFWATLEEPAYVYLMSRPRRDPPVLIYPAEGARQVQPGTVQLPPQSSLLLDQELGIEEFFVFASREPVSRARLVVAVQRMPQPQVAPEPAAIRRSKGKSKRSGPGSDPDQTDAQQGGAKDALAAAGMGNAPLGGERGASAVPDAPPDGAGEQETLSQDGLTVQPVAFRHSAPPPAKRGGTK